MSTQTTLHYVRINNTVNGNPRYLIECPNNLDLKNKELLSELGLRRATDNQKIIIHNNNNNDVIVMNLILSSYNIAEDIARILAHTK